MIEDLICDSSVQYLSQEDIVSLKKATTRQAGLGNLFQVTAAQPPHLTRAGEDGFSHLTIYNHHLLGG